MFTLALSDLLLAASIPLTLGDALTQVFSISQKTDPNKSYYIMSKQIKIIPLTLGDALTQV